MRNIITLDASAVVIFSPGRRRKTKLAVGNFQAPINSLVLTIKQEIQILEDYTGTEGKPFALMVAGISR